MLARAVARASSPLQQETAMAGFSDYLENLVLNLFRATNVTAPATIYVGLFSAAPTDAGGGTEVTTTIRVAGRVAATFAAPSGGAIANSATVDFGTAAGGASLTHFGLFDAASAGNLLAWDTLGASAQTASTGNQVIFAAGALTVTVD
jgi:hypothetical protein